PTQALAIDSALRQLRALLDLWQDCLALRQQFADERADRLPALRYHAQQLAGGRRHHDYGLQGFTAASVALSVFCLSMLWF
ncbi:MAG TPA: FUSC family protein, partial [Pseudomonas sp.]|nr:FUSC family protein [Pseudomonas sp.]